MNPVPSPSQDAVTSHPPTASDRDPVPVPQPTPQDRERPRTVEEWLAETRAKIEAAGGEEAYLASAPGERDDIEEIKRRLGLAQS